MSEQEKVEPDYSLRPGSFDNKPDEPDNRITKADLDKFSNRRQLLYDREMRRIKRLRK